MAAHRQSDLLALLLERGQTPVQEIAEALGASLATIRRDLTELESQGRVERLHGAAQISQGAHKEVAFASREIVNLDAKRSIANRAAEVLVSGASVFLDSSTTVLQLARHIAANDHRTAVFTNSLRVAQELAPFAHIELTLIGGRVRTENMSMVGPQTLEALDKLWIDQLFLGATAIDNTGCLTSVDVDEAAANARMIERSEKSFILADGSKFEKRTTHQVKELGNSQTIITEALPPNKLVQNAKQRGFDVIVASKRNNA